MALLFACPASLTRLSSSFGRAWAHILIHGHGHRRHGNGQLERVDHMDLSLEDIYRKMGSWALRKEKNLLLSNAGIDDW